MQDDLKYTVVTSKLRSFLWNHGADIESSILAHLLVLAKQLLIGLVPFGTFDAELAKIVSGNNQVNELIAQLRHETSMVLFDGIDTYHFWPLFRRF